MSHESAGPECKTLKKVVTTYTWFTDDPGNKLYPYKKTEHTCMNCW